MMKTNLEPIEESDMDLHGKLNRADAGIGSTEKNTESAPSFEQEVAQEISAAEKDDAYGKILSKVQSTQQDDQANLGSISDDAKAVQELDSESQIQHLIDIAQQKGVVHAVGVARHMQDNYVLDTMHDRMLADELHDALIAKGMIEDL